MGNPFQEESAYRLVIDTKDIANPVVAEIIGTHHKGGTDQFQSFQNEEQYLFFQPLKNNIAFFKHGQIALIQSKRLGRQCDLQYLFQH